MNGPQDPILVVDDTESSRYAKARMLRRADFLVLEADSGSRALELIDVHKPRLVVLDVNLPDCDGTELCRRIKSHPDTASILILQVSATYVRDEDTVRALEGGADASLVEPINAQVLVATVRALLRSRQAEDMLRQALELEQNARTAAERANKVKDEFLATLSHELRSPLNAILTWVTLLRSEEVTPEQIARGHAAIERNTRLQVKLVEDLLDVSRIISGKLQLDLGRVELKLVVGAALDSIASAAEAKDVRVTSQLDPELRPLHGDPARLQQIVSNLLSNAVKFTPALGHVDLHVRQLADSVEIRVSDTGRGIEPDFLPHVFERFQQADSSTTRPESGLGLGLAIVRSLAELHHGSVTASSAGPGKGASFTVRIPMGTEGAPDSASWPWRGRRVTTGAGKPLTGLRLVVVDDDADAREAIATALLAAGADVESASSAADALASIERAPVDVLVSDIGMPFEDGFSLIRRLRSAERESRATAALALTAYASIEDQRRALAAGYDGFIAKPATAGELIATVARLARRMDEGNAAS
jgi:signal transduction histidine kinase